jgi:Ca2+:H+ antiporter
MSSLMIVALASLVIPSASYFADLRSNNLEPHLKEGPYILTLSHIAAIILLVFYCLYLFFQLKTHADIFAESNQAEPDGSPELDPWAAGFVLVLSTIGVSVCSDYLVDSVDGSVEELGVSRALQRYHVFEIALLYESYGQILFASTKKMRKRKNARFSRWRRSMVKQTV